MGSLTVAKDEAKDEKNDPAKAGASAEEGAENGGGGEGEEGLHPPKKKLSTKMLVIIGVAVLLLLGGGGAGLYFGGVFGGGTDGTAEGAHDAAGATNGHGAQPAEGASGHDAAAVPAFFPLGDILVNLSGDGKRPNFLKIKVTLELADEKDTPTLEALKPRIIDHFQIYLRELRVEDLRGSAGLYRLREELLLRVTETVKPIRVRDVLFQEMLVQ